ncbi:MAG: FAD:protein FMN transferase [Erysipelotrichia bacterium]|nr:FAD:protein FMN transferase [Erysipelotrichia bacterium]
MNKIMIFLKRYLCVLLIGCLVLAGCQKETKRDKPIGKVSYAYFDTVSYIYDYANDTDEEFDKFSSEVFGILDYYHQLFDIYNYYENVNNLYVINSKAGIEPVKVDRELIDFLLYCKELYNLTAGKMNVMMGAVLSIWHDHRQTAMDNPSLATVPDMEQLQQAAQHISIDSLVIDEAAGTVYIADCLARIDVGAIGKGYATEKAAQYLKENKKDGYVLNIGGNIRIIGNKPDGSKWTTGIKNPNDPDENFPIKISIANTSCVTSGIYERYYTVNKVRYHHIIDEDTLMPANYFSSVSVITENSALADALSTALFCMSKEDGEKVIAKIGNVDVIWIYADGTVEYTENVKNFIVY